VELFILSVHIICNGTSKVDIKTKLNCTNIKVELDGASTIKAKDMGATGNIEVSIKDRSTLEVVRGNIYGSGGATGNVTGWSTGAVHCNMPNGTDNVTVEDGSTWDMSVR